MNRDLIEQYQAGSDKLRRAVAGLSREQLQARPGPGAWSIQEVIVHLADSDAISIDRMKRIVIEDNPSLLYADENAYNDKLHPHEQDLEDTLTLFEVGRRQWARVLRLLPDEAFARQGIHNRRGEVTLGQLVGEYVAHVDDHLNLGLTLPLSNAAL
jgi:uncharacterized damage-inducible protein DinB